ncbi:fimbrial biogenesis outer membrane usher protein [Salmonella enterica subsp. enterica serovar Javiana]|uniref:Fimbrial biogenesis outer membrane usher protein n=1 Tax=Salmonella enterica subsp. enterica serovar Javiana TaxID=363569 RepID=A0A733YAG7_SALET|nr:fimbrial biogenesis outer membrane usher protein [Salmonella enterica subsp. enterica serovar Javiana]EBA9400575.1 fimbrial biogenesis outer membrane usher protein [Salmonella enterica]EBK0598233.1 fimbrial biogenesis outer membrane usher protein [Salmonella enterica]EBM2257585.1 fimbrial biogenesis outer membrane usher protein [Salmonella enterica]EBR8497754.1 fimbrial biogenesis outer membrane usher protein [Salmonella enterica subsp. enterica serovar Javiana]
MPFFKKEGIAICCGAYVLGMISIVTPSSCYAELYFNPALLNIGSHTEKTASQPDLTQFAHGGQLPGVYHVDIYLNNNFIKSDDILFKLVDDKLAPQISLKNYIRMGLLKSAVTDFSSMPDDTVITSLYQFIPDASADFRFYEHKLNISIPQIMLKHKVHGEVDPDTLDDGITAGLMNYTISGAENNSDSEKTSSLFTNFRSGVNWGAWRLRNYSTWSMRKTSRSKDNHFNAINTYLQRNIRSLGSRLTVGDFPTDGDVFESTNIRGTQLMTDEGMIPDVLRSYAPAIRGIANSNAQITVRQSGNVIYQSYVPQGAFEITDLNPSSLSSDLDVTIKESNGYERHFTQAYSSLAVMRRKGQNKYAVTAGRLNLSRKSDKQPVFAQGTFIYGAGHGLTPYTGMIASSEYKSVAAGLGISLGHIGALSTDVTYSESHAAEDKKLTGLSYQFRYAKTLAETNTALSVAAYRYSTKDFRTLTEAYQNDENIQTGKRNELQLMLNQGLGDYGSVYISGSRQSYWQKKDPNLTFNAGYNTSYRHISYGISISKTRSERHKDGSRAALNISVPFDAFTPAYKEYGLRANYSGATDQNDNVTHNIGLSGTALADHNLAFSLNQSYQQQDHVHGGNINTTYTGSHGVVSAGYQYTENNRQLNFGLSGGILVHRNGVVFSQPLGETVALVKAPGASHVKVSNQSGNYTDYRGYAVLTSITPFRKTEVDLNPGSTNSNTELSLTSAFVTPTRGAVVVADYKTKQGEQVLLDLSHDGNPVPFGSTVSLVTSGTDGDNTSIVGDNGQVYMSGMPHDGKLLVSWGHRDGQHCSTNYHIPENKAKPQSHLPTHLTAVCR